MLFYTYLKDEPNDEEEYHYVQTWGRAIREANRPSRSWWSSRPDAGPEVGRSVRRGGYLVSAVLAVRAGDRRPAPGPGRDDLDVHGPVPGQKPTPWWHTDFPLLNYRVPAWIAWRYRIRGLLYWGGMSYWDERRRSVDRPKTLDRRDRTARARSTTARARLVYPGRAVGYDGIAPSLRLKALRDSIEDYEYLAILERAGRSADAEKIVVPLAGSWFDGSRTRAAYEAARAKLAKLLSSLQAGPSRGVGRKMTVRCPSPRRGEGRVRGPRKRPLSLARH